MKKQPEIAVHMSEDLLRRLLYLSEAEKRSPNNQILLQLRNKLLINRNCNCRRSSLYI